MRYLHIHKNLDKKGKVNKIYLQWIDDVNGQIEKIAENELDPSITEKEANGRTLREFVVNSKCILSKGSAPSTVLKPPA